MTDDIFGRIGVADDLEEAVIDTLRLWFPVYIRELEVQQANLDYGVLPLPRSYLTADRANRENADQLPSIVVVSPGTSGRNPVQEGDGSFHVFLLVGVGVFVSAKDRISTKRLVRLYTAIARTIILQKQSLGGYADGTTWLGEEWDPEFGFEDNQTLGMGQVTFEIEVSDFGSRYGGPAVYGGPPPDPDPENQPGSTWPDVESATATIEIGG